MTDAFYCYTKVCTFKWMCSVVTSKCSKSLLYETVTLKLFKLVRRFFGFALPSAQLSKRAAKFENRLVETTAIAADLY